MPCHIKASKMQKTAKVPRNECFEIKISTTNKDLYVNQDK